MKNICTLVLACLLVSACGTPESLPAPPMVGAVGFEGTDLVLVNRDGRTWTDATLIINPDAGGYTARANEVKAGDRVKIPAVQFANDKGERFNVYTHKPVTFRVTATVNGQSASWQTAFTY